MIALEITTPTAVAVRRDGIRHVRAEDASGAFGILPGHADFLTALAIGVVSWRDEAGAEGHCAVRGGILTVAEHGARVAIATREAVPGDDLEHLEREVLTRFQRDEDEEETARTGARRLHLEAVRLIVGFLRPDRGPPMTGRRPDMPEGE
jgi:F-type H+-transporting ATPase subunit epsilon